MAVTERVTPEHTPDDLPPMDVAGRVDRLRARLDESGCEALVVSELTNVRYLTGFTGSAGIVLVTADDLLFVSDGRYRDQSADELAAAGVRILLHRGGLLHTKSIVVDDEVAMFGTHNFDARSLWLNFEVSLFVYDREFCGRLAALQADYRERCLALDPAAWRARGWPSRLVENIVRLFGPLL